MPGPTSGTRCSMPTASSTTLNGLPKSTYRFFVWGYSIGGPVYIPKLFNRDKRKLFFFFSQEYTKQKPGIQNGYLNVPTAAQRAGDFSGYTDQNGVPVALTDPTTGNPVPGNNLSGLMALNPAATKAGQAYPERLAAAEYLRTARRSRRRLRRRRPIRQPAVPAQLLLELQRDPSEAQRHPPRRLQRDIEAEHVGALHQRL